MKIYVRNTIDEKEGYTGIGADAVATLAPDSVDEFLIWNVYETLKDPAEFMEFVHRALKSTGTALLSSPCFASMDAWVQPQAVRGVSEWSLNWLSPEWRLAAKLAPLPYAFNVGVGLGMEEIWKLKCDDTRNFATTRYLNSVRMIQFTLVKK